MQKISQQNELTQPNKANILTQTHAGRVHGRAAVYVNIVAEHLCEAICNDWRSFSSSLTKQIFSYGKLFTLHLPLNKYYMSF